jgi:hypothetical protein
MPVTAILKEMTFTVRYGFSQKFNFPAEDVFQWCTDYRSGDLGLMEENGKRSVERISKDTFLLDDTYRNGGKTVRKKKLVNLYPETLSWVSTHVTGKTRYSQFLYKVSPIGSSSSQVDFTGFQIEYDDKKKTGAKVMSEQLRKEDSHAWELLAKEMENDMRGK